MGYNLGATVLWVTVGLRNNHNTDVRKTVTPRKKSHLEYLH